MSTALASHNGKNIVPGCGGHLQFNLIQIVKQWHPDLKQPRVLNVDFIAGPDVFDPGPWEPGPVNPSLRIEILHLTHGLSAIHSVVPALGSGARGPWVTAEGGSRYQRTNGEGQTVQKRRRRRT